MSDDSTRTMYSGAAAITWLAALSLFVLGLYPLANVLTAGAAIPWYRHALAFWLLVGGTLVLLLSLLVMARRAELERLWSSVANAATRPPWWAFIGACALTATVLSALIAHFVFGRQPHSGDEIAQLFHAKILLSGHLTIPVDPNPEFFQSDEMISGTRWYSQFPLGGPVVLSLGMLVGAAWLLNPVLLGVSVVSSAAFMRRAFGDPTSRAFAVLFALCPFALFMGASFMNHVATMLMVSIAAWQLARWTVSSNERDAVVSAAVIGVALGMAFTIRPLDAVAAAIVIAAVQVTKLDAIRRRSIAVQLVGGLVPVALLLWSNAAMNGATTLFGYEVLFGPAHRWGFHVDPYGTHHTPLRALLFASKYLLQLDVLLFEWPVPAVAVIITGLIALRRPRRWDLFLVGMLFAQLIAYACYWHDGSFRGPRFLFTALPAIIALIVRAPFITAERLRGRGGLVATLLLPACVLVAWFAYGINDSAWGRVRQYRSASIVTKIDPDSIARSAGLHNALVFINEGRESRNLHLLWSLGFTRGDAARLMVSASSCAVKAAIDAEEALVPPKLAGRRDRVIRRALSMNTTESPDCLDDAKLDAVSMASYVPFFPANEIDAEGRITGDVVYALDLGARNEVLRQRFSNRRWYRFGARGEGNEIPRLTAY